MQINVSEEDDEDAMDVDSDPKKTPDDLSQYNLDEYDDDVKTNG